MKARTKLQCEVIQSSKNLWDIKDKMFDWAKIECLDHIGYATKKKVVCMDCGKSFSPELVKRKRAMCPHCNTKLGVEQSLRTTLKQRAYFAIAETYREFQVIRNFEIQSTHKAGKEPYYFCQEILQDWVLPDGKHEIVARSHSMNWYFDSWNGNMEIRKPRNSWYNTASQYVVYPQKYHPKSEFKAMYRKYEINRNLQGLTFLEAIKQVMNDPRMETLLKAKYYSLLSGEAYKITRHWASIKICLRNKYKVKDASMWFDHLDLLDYFGKDLRNAHYVCPKNLNKEHDILVARKRKKQKQEDLERKKKKAIEDNKVFLEMKKQFLDLEFSDGIIRVVPLRSVEDFVDEGDKMHHCVFASNYHLRRESLILSAGINEEPIETVEVDLDKMKIIQSRGRCNNVTAYHKRIIKLVNNNIGLIRQRCNANNKLIR